MGRPLITLLTDFGTTDTYVGQMKGVIAGICPDAPVVDLTHAVRPQQVAQGAFLLETAIAAFPPGAIHVAIVDPGVGTARAGLIVRAADQLLVGPDNGLLSCAIPDQHRPDVAGTITVPAGIEVRVLPHDLGRPAAPTFHGRDIFAVAAARLAGGTEFVALGISAGRMFALPAFRAIERTRALLIARVLHIDHFGNLITSMRRSQFARAAVTGGRPSISIGTHQIDRFVRTYADGDGLVALIGSSGFLEIAEVNGNAAVRLDARLGQEVIVDLGR